MTVSDLIKSSMRLIGVLAAGEAPTGQESIDALESLNLMVKSWNITGLLVFKVTREEFALVANQASRTMGASGDFNTTRPVKILSFGVEDNGIEIPVEKITAEEWALIPNKSVTASNPSKIYPEGTFPLETLNLWPVPTSTNNLVIYSQKAINAAFALSDSLSLPDGYEEALKYDLAVRLAPEFGRQIDPAILEAANEMKANLMRQNPRPSYMQSDAFGLLGTNSFNIYTGS